MDSIGRLIELIGPYLGPTLGFGLAFLIIARLMREKRRPSATVAWLLLMLWVPVIGVPLYLIFGGRKISRLTQLKDRLDIAEPEAEGAIRSSPFGVLTRGNRTRVQATGEQAYRELLQEIRDAKSSIEITTFILSHDSIARRVVKELSKKAKSGVEVRLLLDALGSWGKKTLYMRELEKSGGRIERFMPVLPFLSFGRANLRNHRKLAIFDHSRAIIGGRNIGKEYMGPKRSRKRWQDLSLLIQGPAVTQLSAIFEADWRFACKKVEDKSHTIPPSTVFDGPDASEIEIMASGPDTRGDPLYEKILSVIQEADHFVTIVTPYYIPDEVLQRSLMVKARSGKQVKLVIPKKSNHPVTDLARKHFLRELAEAGVKVLLYRSGMLHGKAIMVDGSIAMTGSANIDLRSLFVNYELGAFLYGDNDIQAIQDWIDELLISSESFDETNHNDPPFLKAIAEDTCRLLAPLL